MSNLFVIVSAIGNNYGFFSYKERFQQLLGSISSINHYAPGSDIVVVDASEDPLPIEDVENLKSLTTAHLFIKDDFCISRLKTHCQDPTPDCFEKKTLGEIRAMLTFFQALKQSNKKYDRVFKLCGRYRLNENFNLQIHMQAENQIVVKPGVWFGKDVFEMRLWSFDYNMLDIVENLFMEIQDITFINLSEKGRYYDFIETNMEIYSKKLNVPFKLIDVVGVEGRFGVSGEFISE